MISFCIPAIGAGVDYLDFYISNLLETASRPDDTSILVSYHTDDDLARLKSILHGVQFVHAPPCRHGNYAASANHSIAIRSLAKAADGDVLIFSDYDMAFLRQGWDEHIHRKLDSVDLFGVAYQAVAVKAPPDIDNSMRLVAGIPLAKYQLFPNLSFMAMRRETLAMLGELTGFDRFLASGGLPFRLINHPSLAKATNLQMGVMQWLDTGCELPHKALELGLKHEAMPAETKPEKGVPRIMLPEWFESEGPFLAHYKKGSSKREHARFDMFDKFKREVNETRQRVARLPVAA